MSYQPSLNDTLAHEQAKQGYTPTLADTVVHENLSQGTPPTGLQGWGSSHPLLGHALADTADVGRDILNIPHHLNSHIPAYLGLIPKFAQTDTNNFDALGLHKNFADELAKTTFESAPFFRGARALVEGSTLLSKLPTLAENTLGGAAFGAASNANNRGEGALGGGLAGVGGTAIGKLIDSWGVKPISHFIAQHSVKPLAKKAVNELQGDVSPDVAVNELKNAHAQKVKDNNALWDKTTGLAQTLDSIKSSLPNPTFNASPYKNYIKQFEKNVGKLEPSLAEPYRSAMGVLDKAKELTPQSIEGAAQLRKNLNSFLDTEAYKKELPKNDEYNRLLGNLKATLPQTIDKNIPDSAKALGNEFHSTWENANRTHQELQDFYDAPNKYGGADVNYKIKDVLKDENIKPDAALLSHFEPKTAQTGINGYEALSKLMGPEKASQAIRSYMTRQIKKGNALDAVKLHKGLNPEQRQAIFGNSKAGKALDAATHVYEELGKHSEGLLDKLPAWARNTASVLSGGTAVGKIASKSPATVKKLVQLAEKGRKNPGKKTLTALLAANQENSSQAPKPLQLTITKGAQ